METSWLKISAALVAVSVLAIILAVNSFAFEFSISVI